MKTLLLFGSPHAHGDTAALADELVNHLRGRVVEIDTYGAHVSPCIDCRRCREGKCVIKDAMTDFYKEMDSYDNVVLASPLYFSQLTGSLLSFVSRFQLFYLSRWYQVDAKYHAKRKGALLLTGGGSTTNIQPAVSTARTVLYQLNAPLVGTVSYLETDTLPASLHRPTLEQVRKLARVLNGDGMKF